MATYIIRHQSTTVITRITIDDGIGSAGYSADQSPISDDVIEAIRDLIDTLAPPAYQASEVLKRGNFEILPV